MWIYNTACHSTEILVSIGHWHSVGECSLVTCNAGCAGTTTPYVPAVQPDNQGNYRTQKNSYQPISLEILAEGLFML